MGAYGENYGPNYQSSTLSTSVILTKKVTADLCVKAAKKRT